MSLRSLIVLHLIGSLCSINYSTEIHFQFEFCCKFAGNSKLWRWSFELEVQNQPALLIVSFRLFASKSGVRFHSFFLFDLSKSNLNNDLFTFCFARRLGQRSTGSFARFPVFRSCGSIRDSDHRILCSSPLIRFKQSESHTLGFFHLVQTKHTLNNRK